MVEVRFKPADVGTVADGAITDVKINAAANIAKSKLASLEIEDADVKTGAAIAQSKLTLAITNSEVDVAAAIAKSKLGSLAIEDADVSAISESKVTNLETDLGNKVGTGPLSGDKKVTAIGWDTVTEEVVVDHEA